MLRQSSSGRVPTVVTPSRRQRSATASPVREEIEMQPMNVDRRRSRAAISGQTGLHPLHLGSERANDTTTNTSAADTNTATSANTNTANANTTPGRRPRLTDEEMVEASAHWRRAPTAPPPAPRLIASGTHGIWYPPAPLLPTTFGITQSDGTTAQVIPTSRGGAGLLLTQEEGRNLRASLERQRLSRPYFWLAALTPITAVVFGLGGFDWVVRAKSGGRVQGCDKGDKWQALWLMAPMSALVWGIVVVVVVMCVLAAE